MCGDTGDLLAVGADWVDGGTPIACDVRICGNASKHSRVSPRVKTVHARPIKEIVGLIGSMASVAECDDGG